MAAVAAAAGRLFSRVAPPPLPDSPSGFQDNIFYSAGSITAAVKKARSVAGFALKIEGAVVVIPAEHGLTACGSRVRQREGRRGSDQGALARGYWPIRAAIAHQILARLAPTW